MQNWRELTQDSSEEEESRLARDLDMPEGVRRISFKATSPNPFDNSPTAPVIYFFLFGHPFDIRPAGAPDSWPWWTLSISPDLPDIEILAWCMRALIEGSPVYAETLWHPERGFSTSIKGLEHEHSMGTYIKAYDALRFLETRKATRGRKSGSTSYTCAELKDAITQAVKTLKSQPGSKINQEEIAALVGYDPSTLSTRGTECFGRNGLRRIIRGGK